MAVVEVIYYTDPACPWSWAAEPALRRLLTEFGDEVRITYVLAGLAREITDPEHELVEALDAAAASGMPVDPRSWAGRGGRPPRTTYPACLAAKAAAEQQLAGPYLRVLREGFWLRGAALDTPDALEEAARAVPAMNLERFAIDLRSNAIAEAFGGDLERARSVPEERRSPSADPPRAVLPSFEVRGAGAPRWLAEPSALAAAPRMLRDAVAAAGAEPGRIPSPEEAIRALGAMTTAEVAAACDLPWPRAAAELWRLALDFRLRPERIGGSELWHIA
ncbi:MAG TPA: DsbA family protein [Baekduia sp.]|nr:DsbA family protein [Baekduia sp.]